MCVSQSVHMAGSGLLIVQQPVQAPPSRRWPFLQTQGLGVLSGPASPTELQGPETPKAGGWRASSETIKHCCEGAATSCAARACSLAYGDMSGETLGGRAGPWVVCPDWQMLMLPCPAAGLPGSNCCTSPDCTAPLRLSIDFVVAICQVWLSIFVGSHTAAHSIT